MTGVLMEEKHRDRRCAGRRPVGTQVGVMQPQAEEHAGTLGTTRREEEAREDFLQPAESM